jgi:hypothetical protein
MELFRRIALGLVATASALVASFATIQSPSNNLASTNIDNSTSQQSIVEEKEARTIYNSAPQTQELDQETKTQLLKISANPDKSIKIQIDKNLIKKPNSTKAVKSSNKFKTILPSIGFGAAAQATPSGSFRIKSQNGNLVDVFGDSLPRSKGPVHLWNSQDKSNLFALGPNEGTGNEIRIASDTSLCITPDSPLNSKPKVGTPIVAKRDCSNSYNFKFDGAKIYLGRYPDLCLDIPNNNDSQSQRLQVFDCNGSSAQSFETVGGHKAQLSQHQHQPLLNHLMTNLVMEHLMMVLGMAVQTVFILEQTCPSSAIVISMKLNGSIVISMIINTIGHYELNLLIVVVKQEYQRRQWLGKNCLKKLHTAPNTTIMVVL